MSLSLSPLLSPFSLSGGLDFNRFSFYSYLSFTRGTDGDGKGGKDGDGKGGKDADGKGGKDAADGGGSIDSDGDGTRVNNDLKRGSCS